MGIKLEEKKDGKGGTVKIIPQIKISDDDMGRDPIDFVMEFRNVLAETVSGHIEYGAGAKQYRIGDHSPQVDDKLKVLRRSIVDELFGKKGAFIDVNEEQVSRNIPVVIQAIQEQLSNVTPRTGWKSLPFYLDTPDQTAKEFINALVTKDVEFIQEFITDGKKVRNLQESEVFSKYPVLGVLVSILERKNTEAIPDFVNSIGVKKANVTLRDFLNKLADNQDLFDTVLNSLSVRSSHNLEGDDYKISVAFNALRDALEEKIEEARQAKEHAHGEVSQVNTVVRNDIGAGNLKLSTSQ